MAIWSNFGPNLTSLNMGHASSAADIRFGLKVGQVGSKWDNSGDFSRSDSVHFDSVRSGLVHYRCKIKDKHDLIICILDWETGAILASC